MASKLAFIGGGLLEGLGKGLVETGKAKREAALVDLEHKRGLKRDEKRLEGRRGLLDASNTAAMGRLELNIGSREGLAGKALDQAASLASKATNMGPHLCRPFLVEAQPATRHSASQIADMTIGAMGWFWTASPGPGSPWR